MTTDHLFTSSAMPTRGSGCEAMSPGRAVRRTDFVSGAFKRPSQIRRPPGTLQESKPSKEAACRNRRSGSPPRLDPNYLLFRDVHHLDFGETEQTPRSVFHADA